VDFTQELRFFLPECQIFLALCQNATSSETEHLLGLNKIRGTSFLAQFPNFLHNENPDALCSTISFYRCINGVPIMAECPIFLALCQKHGKYFRDHARFTIACQPVSHAPQEKDKADAVTLGKTILGMGIIGKMKVDTQLQIQVTEMNLIYIQYRNREKVLFLP
jgi:hypothetical protein